MGTPPKLGWNRGWVTGVMSRKPAISLKRCKIGPRLLRQANRKSHTRFQLLVPGTKINSGHTVGVKYFSRCLLMEWSCMGTWSSQHRETCLGLQRECLTKSSSTRAFSHLYLCAFCLLVPLRWRRKMMTVVIESDHVMYLSALNYTRYDWFSLCIIIILLLCCGK